MALRDVIQRVHEYNVESNRITNEWYLMDYCPYDGASKTMVVIDRSVVSKDMLEDPVFGNPILTILRAMDLYGCYVTDSEEWIPANDYKKMFGTSHERRIDLCESHEDRYYRP